MTAEDQYKPPPVHTPSTLSDLIASFFFKTPPFPSECRSLLFNHLNLFSRPNKWQNHTSSNNRFHYLKMPSILRRKQVIRRFFGYKQEGHILRNCPEKHKYLSMFEQICHGGTAAVMLIEPAENVTTDEIDDVATFITDSMDEPGNKEDVYELNA